MGREIYKEGDKQKEITNNTNRNKTERTKNKPPVRQSLDLQEYQRLSRGWENTTGLFPKPGKHTFRPVVGT